MDEEFESFLLDLDDLPTFKRFFRASERIVQTDSSVGYATAQEKLFSDGNEKALFEKTKELMSKVGDPFEKALLSLKEKPNNDLQRIVGEFILSSEPYM